MQEVIEDFLKIKGGDFSALLCLLLFDVKDFSVCIKGQEVGAERKINILVAIAKAVVIIAINTAIYVNDLVAVPGAVGGIVNLDLDSVRCL